jgi:hypothetical protein
MPIKKLAYIIVALMVLASVSGKAQMSISFLSSNGGIISTPSMNLGGTSKCLVIGGSAASLNVANNGTGAFDQSCKEKPPVADTMKFSLSLNMYPNPTRGSTTLKASGDFDENLFCVVKVIALDGKILFGERIQMSKIKAGFKINGDRWAAGTYVVTVELMNKRYSLQLSKL